MHVTSGERAGTIWNLDGHLSGTSFPDGELDVVYRLQKFKQNGRRLYCSYQLDSNFQFFIFF